MGGDRSALRVFSDLDWAGCPRTRKSTSGGIIVFRGAVLTHWSSTQTTIALSSGEAEYAASAKASAEGLGVKALAADVGLDLAAEVGLDSSAAKSAAGRAGVGKIRHLETKRLWVQEAVRQGRLALVKIRGYPNPADVLNKPLGSADIFKEKLSKLGVEAVRRQAG